MVSLNTKAWISTVALAVVMGLLIFGIAGTLHYWQAWVYLGVISGVMVLSTLYLVRHDPALLARRMKGGPTAEQRPEQQLIMCGTSLGFIALLAVPALDHRFGWSSVPVSVVAAGDLLVVLGFGLILLVFRENAFASATIELAKDQRVISTGPYGIVRHPMYASAFFYLIGTPLALGSYWGLIGVAAILPLLVWRILDEEQLLASQLVGYTEYQKQVPYRLIPGVW